MSDGEGTNPIAELRAHSKGLENDLKEAKAQLEAANSAARERDELKARLDAIEAEKLSTEERLRKQIEDLQPVAEEAKTLKQKVEQAEARAKSAYEAELAKLPDDKRSQIELLTQNGDWAVRLDALNVAKGLLPTNEPIGSVTNPGPAGAERIPPTDGAKVKEVTAPKPPTNWSEAFPDLNSKIAAATRNPVFDTPEA